MAHWTLEVGLDPDADTPVFLQIARALSDDVRRGRLRPGAPVPGSRRLAESLGVHRNTVLAAYQELEAEGWLETKPARGTFVTTSLPERPPRRFAQKVAPRAGMPARPGFELGPAPTVAPRLTTPPGVLSLGGGVPDLRRVPAAALARAYRRALRRHGRTVLDYGDARGHPRLRAAVAEMLSSRRGLVTDPESVLITRGSQMALDLVARSLLRPGDAVAVEELGYRPAWDVLRLAGARLVPLPVDAQGLDVEALARVLTRERVRAIYLTPHHQYPTTAVLSPGRRLRLLELAAQHRLAVIEDDFDHEFHYEGRPVLPLAAADRAGVVVYVGTLSKILAPGLRLGFLVAPAPMLQRVSSLRHLVDRQGDHAVECAVAELLEDGEVQRHARRMRRLYQARRDVLVSALRQRLGSVLRFEVPAGGISLWAKVERAVDVDAWAERALARGVAFFPARHFAFDGRSRPAARLGFAALEEKELTEAVKRMHAAL
jgi:GntR family transcriptional regulator/MocR family aminotransferase